MKPSEIDIQPLNIPKFWRFNEKWCQKNIDNVYDLNKICKHSDASYDISYFIYGYGEEVHSNIKFLNTKINAIKNGAIDEVSPSNIEFFVHDMDGGSYDTSWERLPFSILSKLEVVNYELAPEVVQNPIKEIFNLIKTGKELYLNCKAILTDIADEKRSAERINIYNSNSSFVSKQNNLMKNKTQDSEKIERSHVKIKEGFVYVMAHSLMKEGLYKVGFTSRNPDIRAVELSRQIGIPGSFKVIHYWRSTDPYIVEQRIHTVLGDYSIGGEFFECNLELIVNEVVKNEQIKLT